MFPFLIILQQEKELDLLWELQTFLLFNTVFYHVPIVASHQYKGVLLDLANLKVVEELSVRSIEDMWIVILQLLEYAKKFMGMISLKINQKISRTFV